MEHNHSEDPIDLRVLAANHDPKLEDRVVNAVLARVRHAESRSTAFAQVFLEHVPRFRWPVLAVATGNLLTNEVISFQNSIIGNFLKDSKDFWRNSHGFGLE